MEVEAKSLLQDRREYERLRRALAPPRRCLDQHNLYFDTDDQGWSRHRVAVRLRWENGRPELTVKTAGRARGDFVERGEYECRLSLREGRHCQRDGRELAGRVFSLLDEQAPELAEELAALRGEPLREVGSMHTRREVYHLSGEDGRVLAAVELDETTYPDRSIVWEVELEVDEGERSPDALAGVLRRRLESEGIAWRPSTVSKRERLQRIVQG